jgi:hypothetical protein
MARPARSQRPKVRRSSAARLVPGGISGICLNDLFY